MPESQQPEEGQKIMLEMVGKKRNLKILDIGAGEGKWSRLLKNSEFKDNIEQLDGIEAWPDYISKYGLKEKYDTLYNCDMRKFDFKTKYDVAIMGDVLEHIPFQDALEFIKKLKENVDSFYLIIPTSTCIQDGNFYGNPYETHRYQWKHDELVKHFGVELIQEGTNPNGLVKIGTYVWKR